MFAIVWEADHEYIHTIPKYQQATLWRSEIGFGKRLPAKQGFLRPPWQNLHVSYLQWKSVTASEKVQKYDVKGTRFLNTPSKTFTELQVWGLFNGKGDKEKALTVAWDLWCDHTFTAKIRSILQLLPSFTGRR